VFEKAEIINTNDSEEEDLDEENQQEKNLRENKYSNLDHVNRSTKLYT
jgi:hypothetical protein